MVGGVLVWWLLVGRLSAYISSRHNVTDSTITHMGSEGQKFWYVALIWGLVLAPGVVLPIFEAIRHRYTPYLLTTVSVLTGIGLLLAADSSGIRRCELSDNPVPFLCAATSATFVGAGLLTSRRGRLRHSGIALSLAMATLTSYFVAVIFGECGAPSYQVALWGPDALIFLPFVWVFMYLVAAVGIWSGSRATSTSIERSKMSIRLP